MAYGCAGFTGRFHKHLGNMIPLIYDGKMYYSVNGIARCSHLQLRHSYRSYHSHSPCADISDIQPLSMMIQRVNIGLSAR